MLVAYCFIDMNEPPNSKLHNRTVSSIYNAAYVIGKNRLSNEIFVIVVKTFTAILAGASWVAFFPFKVRTYVLHIYLLISTCEVSW